ncbi:GNAT family N-acetyltransferase [Actinomycetospora flava]|uniref:GNAT family N-acetyltransferase n=1 Tax=Actinomycetospora flava TaxID=3129232 RepID=A0ABU8LZY8_9PSEU
MTTIRRAAADDWVAARDVRLRALADAPGVFASTLAREQAYDEAEWRRRVSTHAWFLAGDVGVAVGVPEPDDPDGRHLVGMWVAPEYRGHGVADALVDAVVGWARDEGAVRLALWVVDGNPRARGFYERHGFVATGERGPLPSDPAVTESRMTRSISSGRGTR